LARSERRFGLVPAGCRRGVAPRVSTGPALPVRAPLLTVAVANQSSHGSLSSDSEQTDIDLVGRRLRTDPGSPGERPGRYPKPTARLAVSHERVRVRPGRLDLRKHLAHVLPRRRLSPSAGAMSGPPVRGLCVLYDDVDRMLDVIIRRGGGCSGAVVSPPGWGLRADPVLFVARRGFAGTKRIVYSAARSEMSTGPAVARCRTLPPAPAGGRRTPRRSRHGPDRPQRR
jgi:hypothetical protein